VSNLLNFKWDLSKPIYLYLADCPWPDEVEIQLAHQCDYINYITYGRIDLRYGGRVDRVPEIPDIKALYCKFIETADNNVAAWAWPKLIPGGKIIGGVNFYRMDKVKSIEEFAGISVHELLHLLRFAHVPYNSVMTYPYLPFNQQALLHIKDFETLDKIAGIVCRRVPAVYFWENKARIRIPSIQIAENVYKSVILEVTQGDDITMYAAPETVLDVVRRDKTSYIDNNVLHFPLRHQGTSYQVSAEIVETNDRFEFVNVQPLPEIAQAA